MAGLILPWLGGVPLGKLDQVKKVECQRSARFLNLLCLEEAAAGLGAGSARHWVPRQVLSALSHGCGLVLWTALGASSA